MLWRTGPPSGQVLRMPVRKAEVPARRSLEARAGDRGRHEWSQPSGVTVALQESAGEARRGSSGLPRGQGHHPGADERQEVQDVWKRMFCHLLSRISAGRKQTGSDEPLRNQGAREVISLISLPPAPPPCLSSPDFTCEFASEVEVPF